MKRCKRDCKFLNKQGTVSADRISELSEALILQILSLLPTKDAIATSVLSKKWQSRWKFLPTLKFDSYNHGRELGTFSNNVCKALLSHKAPILHSLDLIIRSKNYNAMDTGKLIEIAIARNVRKLVLDVETAKQFIFPKCLYNCETLETLELKLNRFGLMDVLSSVSLKPLRTLHLFYVRFKDDRSLLKLLSGCPKLENLVLHGIPYNNVKTITIAMPSLQRLSISYGTDKPRPSLVIKAPRCSWVINAPSLKYLTIRGIYDREFCMNDHLAELQEANIIDVSADEINNEKLMGSLTSVKRLCLSLPPFKNKLPTGIIFYQLVYLELHTYEEEWWNLLTFMLDRSPKLQVLKLSRLPSRRNYFVPLGKWNQPKNVPECLLLHLETFMWEYFDWERGNYKSEVAKYILSNANCLKRATFISSTKITCTRRVKMLEDLNSVVKASNSCQIIFK